MCVCVCGGGGGGGHGECTTISNGMASVQVFMQVLDLIKGVVI